MAIASENMVFYYMQRDSLCFLTLCEEKYPKRLAFLYLEEIADIILKELTNEYGDNVSFPRHFLTRKLCFHLNKYGLSLYQIGFIICFCYVHNSSLILPLYRITVLIFVRGVEQLFK